MEVDFDRRDMIHRRIASSLLPGRSTLADLLILYRTLKPQSFRGAPLVLDSTNLVTSRAGLLIKPLLSLAQFDHVKLVKKLDETKKRVESKFVM